MTTRFEIVVRAKDGEPEDQVAAIAEGFANGLQDGWEVALRPVEGVEMTEEELAQIAGGAVTHSEIIIRPRRAR